MAFCVVNYSPSGFGVNDTIFPNGADCCLEIGDFKEQDSFVLRWIWGGP